MAVPFNEISNKRELIDYHNKHGSGHYFEARTMRFFNSIVHDRVLNLGDMIYFVTSEQYRYETPRLFTVRQMAPDAKPESFSRFQQYSTLDDAYVVLDELESNG